MKSTEICKKQQKTILFALPPVHFHVLPIEEEDGGRNESDVKVLDIDWHTVHINAVDGRHLGQLICRLGQLAGQFKKISIYGSFSKTVYQLCDMTETVL